MEKLVCSDDLGKLVVKLRRNHDISIYSDSLEGRTELWCVTLPLLSVYMVANNRQSAPD